MIKAYTLNPGLESNPLRKHRNIPCPCGKPKKAKNCCGRYAALPVKIAAIVRKYLETHHPKEEK